MGHKSSLKIKWFVFSFKKTTFGKRKLRNQAVGSVVSETCTFSLHFGLLSCLTEVYARAHFCHFSPNIPNFYTTPSPPSGFQPLHGRMGMLPTSVILYVYRITSGTQGNV